MITALKRRLTAGWNLSRVLFILIGGSFIIESIEIGIGPVTVPGIYFFSMGLLGFGCASGSCAVPGTTKKSKEKARFNSSEL